MSTINLQSETILRRLKEFLLTNCGTRPRNKQCTNVNPKHTNPKTILTISKNRLLKTPKKKSSKFSSSSKPKPETPPLKEKRDKSVKTNPVEI